jgi:hypothetical protein
MILPVTILKEDEVPDFQVNEPVMTPIGIASYKGRAGFQGQHWILVSFLPAELQEEDRRSRGYQDLRSIQEDLVTKVEDEV